MIDDELLNKFDNINDLPVSEEMLGAYLEGNLDALEDVMVGSIYESHPDVKELVSYALDDTPDVQSDFLNEIEADIVEDIEPELPEIPVFELQELDAEHSFFGSGPGENDNMAEAADGLTPGIDFPADYDNNFATYPMPDDDFESSQYNDDSIIDNPFDLLDNL